MTDIGSRLLRLPAETRVALAFFSRLPVAPPAGPFDLRQSAAAWPLAGAILAGFGAAVLLVTSAFGAPPLVAALLALGGTTALTGGLHEDGLADTADGLGGGRSRDKKLAIMRDSRLGTFGALALIFAVGLKAAAIAALILDPWSAAAVLVCAGVLSRSFALWHWRATLPARTEGLALAAGRPDALALLIGSGFGLVSAVLLFAVCGWNAAMAVAVAWAATAAFSRLCTRSIGGHTGDTIGAAQQIAETLLLTVVAIGWAPIPA